MYNNMMPWQGGKLRLAEKLNSALNTPHLTYVEPFVGSGGLFLNIDWTDSNHIINDLDEGIYSLWTVLASSRYIEFTEEFCNIPVNSKYFTNFKMQKKTGYPDNDEFQKALIIYYLTVYAFNGDMKSMRYLKDVGEHENMKKHAAKRLMANIENAHFRASNSTIKNVNALDLIDEYKDDSNTLIYLDPPYVYDLMGEKKDLYNISFNTSDQKIMLELVKSAKAKVCISGYRGGSLLYDQYLNKGTGWHSYLLGEVTRSAGMYGAVKGNEHNKVKEFIWVNYDISEKSSSCFNTFDFSLDSREIDFSLSLVHD